MKNEIPVPVRRCGNEGCPRPAESGEAYCCECGLEWSLFRRDWRRENEEERTHASRSMARR
jgi:hypothetical protein